MYVQCMNIIVCTPDAMLLSSTLTMLCYEDACGKLSYKISLMLILIIFNLICHYVNSYHYSFRESVILGVHNDTKARICTDEFCTDPPRNVPLLPAIIHPQYESNTHNHDIALIPLKQKINFTGKLYN